MTGYTFTPILSKVANSGLFGVDAINSRGQILFSFGSEVYVYSNGVLTDVIGPSGVFNTTGLTINNSGLVLAEDNGTQSNDPVFVESVGGSPTAISITLPVG